MKRHKLSQLCANHERDSVWDSYHDIYVLTMACFRLLQVMAMPNVSAAFEEFSRKALCQESLFFLKDVTM